VKGAPNQIAPPGAGGKTLPRRTPSRIRRMLCTREDGRGAGAGELNRRYAGMRGS